ncbi:MAG: lactate racemase [Clostridia bacterium]|nr:lactate racemase [Clostridia bacterium]
MVDDISRPTPVADILPLVMEELVAGGLEPGRVTVVVATACHRCHAAEDNLKKIGPLSEQLCVVNHDPIGNLVYLGATTRGTPLYINKYVAEADLKVGIGCIVPHSMAGYGGGAKIILPGVAGLETVKANHSLYGERGDPAGSSLRYDIHEAAAKIGLDFIINVVFTGDIRVGGIFSGHYIEAFEEGVRFARQVYHTTLPDRANVVIANAYPLDLDLFQACKALWMADHYPEADSLVLVAGCPEGVGAHRLFQRGGPLWSEPEESFMFNHMLNRHAVIFTPAPIGEEVYDLVPRHVKLLSRWESMLEELLPRQTGNAEVLYFPYAPLQIPG